jgi:hypothetical protein
MARTRYTYRGYDSGVADLRGRALKKLHKKVTSKALLPRNSQLVTRSELHHQYLKVGGVF